MSMINNPFGQDPVDFNEETSADRIGRRIRDIRIAKGLSQAALGEKVGLNADRIQKYENGVRKPKLALLKKIASALEVESIALADPVVSNYFGAMHALFEMEKLYDLRVEKRRDGLVLVFGDGRTDLMNSYLTEWEKVLNDVNEQLSVASTEEEKQAIINNYNNWKWTFPKSISGRLEKSYRKAKLQERISVLQKELDSLGED